jgi:hypothetical protein
LILSRGLAALDPGAAGEVHTPLDFAALPGSMARRLFDPGVIEAQLDHLARGATRGRGVDVQLAGLVICGRGGLAGVLDGGRAPGAAG